MAFGARSSLTTEGGSELVPIQKWKSATTGISSSFQIRNEQFFARSRRSRDCAETYKWYVAQEIPQIDAEIAEKGHFWMETR